MEKTSPTFRSRPAFKLIGIERYTENGVPSIREAWEAFSKRFHDIPNVIDRNQCYGFEDYSRDFVMKEGSFPKYYNIASQEVTSFDNLPEGMKAKEVPAAEYAVFSYQGPISDLPKFFGYIYAEWMPASGFKMDPQVSSDFEFYSEPMKDMNDAKLEVWVPIVKK